MTGPEASAQVMLKGVPAVTDSSWAAVFVNITALATASVAAARRTLENCILIDSSVFEVKVVETVATRISLLIGLEAVWARLDA